jgi:glycosidase
MVANHTSAYHPWVTEPPSATWYNGTADRHLANTWQTWTLADPYSPPAMRKETLDGWFINILPDLNQDDPEVARYIIQNTLWWVGATGIDGIRQDTWPYVPRAFWRDWMTAIKREHPTLRVVGEVFDGDPTMIAFFEGGRTQFDGIDDKVDALFDFPLFFTLRNAFAQGKPLREVAVMLSRDRLYLNPSSLVTFLGLHDVGRFMNEPGATTDGLKLAYTFLFTARGTPLIYYGDEIAMPGGNDPDNRRDYPGGWSQDARNAFEASGRTADEQAVWSHVQRLLRLRAERSDLRRGTTEHLHVGEQTFVYRRGRTVVALNNGTRQAEVSLPVASLPNDALGLCPAPRPAGDGVVTVVIPARTGCVF